MAASRRVELMGGVRAVRRVRVRAVAGMINERWQELMRLSSAQRYMLTERIVVVQNLKVRSNKKV